MRTMLYVNIITNIATSAFYRWRTWRSTIFWLLAGAISSAVGSAIELFGGGQIHASLALFSSSGILIIFLHASISGSREFKNNFIANTIIEYGSRFRIIAGEAVWYGFIGIVSAFCQLIANSIVTLIALSAASPSSLTQNFILNPLELVIGFLLFFAASALISLLGGFIGFALRSPTLSILVVLTVYLALEPALTAALASWEMPMKLIYAAPSSAIDMLAPASWESLGSMASLVCWAGASGIVAWMSFKAYKP